MSDLSPDFVDSCRLLFDYLQRNKTAVASLLVQYCKKFVSRRKEFKGYRVTPKLDRMGGGLFLEIYTPDGDYAVYSKMMDGVVVLSDIPKNMNIELKPCLNSLMGRLSNGIAEQIRSTMRGQPSIPFIAFGPIINVDTSYDHRVAFGQIMDSDTSYDRMIVKLIMTHIFKNVFKETLWR